MTLFDLALIAILGVSIFFAAARGAIRELATLLALGIAGLVAYAGYKPVAALFGKAGSFLASAGAAIILAGLVFAASYFLLHIGMGRLKLSKQHAQFDRIGGGVFGLLRGLALIGLGFLGYGYALDEANQPESVRRAFLLPVAEVSASFFESLVPASNRLGETPPPASANNAAAEGYNRADRTGLEDIVATVTTRDPPAQPEKRSNGDSNE